MGEEVDEWISQFKGELERGLRTRLRGVRLPPTAAGDLAEEPSRQLARRLLGQVTRRGGRQSNAPQPRTQAALELTFELGDPFVDFLPHG